jgi:cytoskeletal protein CcmA (bactofilin family)
MLRGLFQKNANNGALRVVAGTSEASVLIVGSDDTRTDGVIFSGTVQVDGRIEGDIRCNRIVVTRHARIDGAVSAHSATIDGTVNGPIDAVRIFLGPTAAIKGNLTYQMLNIATGASVTGFCRDRGQIKTDAANRTVRSGPPPLAFNLAKSACSKRRPADLSPPPAARECHTAPGSMKAVWETYQRDARTPARAAIRSIASLAAARAVTS